MMPEYVNNGFQVSSLDTINDEIEKKIEDIERAFGEGTQKALNRVYELVKKNPSLLHGKDDRGWSLLQIMLTRAGQGFTGRVGEEGYLSLAIKLIELDPTVNVNYHNVKKRPSDYKIGNLENVLCWFTPSKQRTELLKYLVFLGAEIDGYGIKEKSLEELRELKVALTKELGNHDVQTVFPKLYATNPACIEEKLQEFLL